MITWLTSNNIQLTKKTYIITCLIFIILAHTHDTFTQNKTKTLIKVNIFSTLCYYNWYMLIWTSTQKQCTSRMILYMEQCCFFICLDSLCLFFFCNFKLSKIRIDKCVTLVFSVHWNSMRVDNHRNVSLID